MKTLIAFLPLLCVAAPVFAERPNIILILCDDLGYSDVGFNGATDIQTPALDALAREGTIFGSAYVTHPFCGPSRMGMMTGRYSHKFGAPFNLPETGRAYQEYFRQHQELFRQGVDTKEPLMSSVLQDAGYFTGAIGKWHMGSEPQYHPNQRGFDEYYGFLGGGHNYFPEQYRPIYKRQKQAGLELIWDYVKPLEHNGVEVDEKEYITDGLSREAVRFVNQAAEKDEPFFLYLAYNAPHTPLEAKEDDLRVYANIKDEKRRTYAAMVRAIDRGVGKLAEALKATGHYDDTLVVFLSDNGGKLTAGATNRPLREGKGSTCEGGYRVPMFFHWPGHVPAGQRFEYPVSALDFYPTFARLGGAEIPAGKQLDGRDIWEDFQAGRNPHEADMIYALRHRNGYSDVGAREDQWKICRTYRQKWKLFNIDLDPSEQKDLSAENPERVREMISKVEAWSRSHPAPLWFHALEAKNEWSQTKMPNYEETFKID